MYLNPDPENPDAPARDPGQCMDGSRDVAVAADAEPAGFRPCASDQPQDTDFALVLDYRPPFDWRAMLEFLAVRAVPGMETVGSASYARTIVLDGSAGHMEARFHQDLPRVSLAVRFPDSSKRPQLAERTRRLFDLHADSAGIDVFLASDPLLRPLVTAAPGTRVPGCWDGFELAVRAIVGQQVSVAAAATLVGRLVRRLGQPVRAAAWAAETGLTRAFPSPEALAEGDLAGLGITTARVAAIRSLADGVRRGELCFDGSQEPQSFRARLCGIRGIGDWTAQYIALRALRDRDAFPAGDLVLQKVVAGPGGRLSAAELARRSLPWQPWRAYAVMQLWRRQQPDGGCRSA